MTLYSPQKGVVPLDFGAASDRIVHAFSTRTLGNMSVSRETPAEVLAHRAHFCSLMHVPYDRTFLVPQTHSTNILIVSEDQLLNQLSSVRLHRGGGKLMRGGADETVSPDSEWKKGIDGVILRIPDLYAMVTTADCAPIGFIHEASGTLGLAHAGLIGAINQLPATMVKTMHRELECPPAEVQVTVGPCIRKCHYDLSKSGVWKQIGEQVLTYYGRDNKHFERGYFDLPGFIIEQLVQVGIPRPNIHDSGLCTACEYDSLYSNFAAGEPAAKAREGRFATILGRTSR